MRLGFVLARLSESSAFEGSPITDEWLAGLTGDHAVFLAVDEDGPGVQRMRDLGAQVHVSGKRSMADADGTPMTADQVAARWMAGRHRTGPLDCIVYDCEVPTDYAWFEASLDEVPRGVALGGGPCRDLRAVWDDPDLFDRYGRMIWAAAGLVATADFLLSDAAAEAYGFRGTLPSRLRVTPAALMEQPTIPARPGLVTVVATTEGPTDLASIVGKVVETVPIGTETTIAVVHRDLPVAGTRTRDLVLRSVASGLRTAVIAVPVDADDATAAEFVDTADVLVLARPTDAVIPAVVEAMRRRPWEMIGGKPSTFDTPVFPQGLPTVSNRMNGLLLNAEGPPSGLADALESLEDVDADVAVVHDAAGAKTAARLVTVRSVEHADVVVIGGRSPIFGHIDPKLVSPHVVAFGRPIWGSVARLARQVDSLADVIRSVTSLEHVEDVRLLAMPSVGDGLLDVSPVPERGRSPVVAGTGILPRPRHVSIVREQVMRPPVESGSDDLSVKRWAEHHRWSDRVRLALPWRWGLLPRSMRGRW